MRYIAAEERRGGGEGVRLPRDVLAFPLSKLYYIHYIGIARSSNQVAWSGAHNE